MIKKPIYPPRPRGKISPSDLPYYERTGEWIAQRKFNDSRTLLRVDLGRELSVWNRHGGKHVRFSLSKSLAEEIKANLNLDANKTYWIDGGVMNKTKDGPNCLVFFDILEAGRYFFRAPDQMKRLEILYSICGNPTGTGDPASDAMAGLALKISPNLWLAETFTDKFIDRFNEACDPEFVAQYPDWLAKVQAFAPHLPFSQPRKDMIEGVVLRRKDSALDSFGNVEYETDWQLRCRKPHKNYNF